MKLTSATIALAALASAVSANPVQYAISSRRDALKAEDSWFSSVNASASSSDPAATSASSAAADDAFPTDIGYLGAGSNGQVPFLAEQDKLNGSRGNSPYEYRWNATDATREEFDIFTSLGNLSPYHSSKLFPNTTANKRLNDTCSVKQAHIFHRHGARYPTSSNAEGAPHFGAVVGNWTKAGNLTASGELAFLTNWTYELGAEYLVPLGAQQLFDSGVYHYYQYGKLLNQTLGHKPVVRVPSQSRMLNSSRYWTLGFFGWDAPTKINLEVVIEEDGFNSTLSPYYDCPASNNITIGDTYLRATWDPIYLKNATERLQKYTNLELDADLVYGMQSLCAYESAGLGYSNFCDLFTAEEWRGFEYDLDMQFQGDYGAMSPSGRSQGIGYALELLQRLTNGSYTGPDTTRNSTLDNSATFFPLDQPLYVDFTHDDVIVSALTALNFTQFYDYLDPKAIKTDRNFILSEITPFAARLVFEVIECSGESYIRALINEAVIPMDEGQGCKEARPDGLCGLQDFIDYQQKYALDAANFNKTCFGVNGTDYTITGPSVRNGTLY